MTEVLIGFGIAALVLFAVAAAMLIPAKKQIGESMIGAAVSVDTLCSEMTNLAFRCKAYSGSGAGRELKGLNNRLRRGYRSIAKKAAWSELYGFERWIFDNFHIAGQRISDLSGNKFYLLPHIDGKPRIYHLCRKLVMLTECRITSEAVNRAVGAFQSECRLSGKEIESLKSMTEFCCLEYLAEIAGKSLAFERMRRAASSEKASDKTFDKYAAYNSFCYSFADRGEDDICRLTKYLERKGKTLHDKKEVFCNQLARYNALASSCIDSLKKTHMIFDAEATLSMQNIHAVFCRESVGVYQKMTAESKLAYVARAAELAHEYQYDETEYASDAIKKANSSHSHIGALLFDKKSSRNAQRFYILLTIIFSIAASIYFALFFDALWQRTAFGILAFIPILMIIKELTSRIIFPFGKRLFLPSFDFSNGVPDSCRTLTVVSEMICGREQAERAVKNLLALQSSNNDENLDFALLVDFCAAATSGLRQEESGMLEYFKGISAKYRKVKIFVRSRQEAQGRFQGWERKRGAIMQLMQELRGADCGFLLKPGIIPVYQNIIALDADTFSYELIKLIELSAHPLNSRYCIIAPDIRSVIGSNMTAFERLHANFASAYSYGAGNLSQDLFGIGNFMGKGIINIDCFLKSCDGFFPDNRILSHDYVEGAVCGAVNSGVTGFESYPRNFKSFLLRQLRWMRGDIQLLPYIFPTVRNRAGKRVKNPVEPYAKFNIFCNILLALRPISAFILLCLSPFLGAFWYIALIAAVSDIIIELLTDWFVGIKALFYDQSFSSVFRDRIKTAAKAIYSAAVLPVFAFEGLKAAAMTFCRMFITKKKLLEWNTFASSDGTAGAAFYLRVSIMPMIITAAACAAAYILEFAYFPLLVLGALIVLSVPLNLLLGKTKKDKVISQKQKTMLDDCARQMWKYFEDTVTKENNYLTADNYQKYLNKGFVYRTSPTDIGFSISSAVCAHSFGYIDGGRLSDYLKKVLDSVDSLEKYRGNLYNWYDVKSKQVLQKYISSVDSGNFISCLLLAKIYLEHIGIGQELVKKIDRLIGSTDLGFLYSRERGLLYVGYNEETAKFDNAHYDLCASEALLTYITAASLNKISGGAIDKLSKKFIKYGKPMLASWTGGCFEYLMPSLFLDIPVGTLVGRSSVNHCYAQISYAKKHGMNVFGMSESQYFHTDNAGNLQYKAFGVDTVALKQGKSSKVVSPYSSFLMLKFVPREAAANLCRLLPHYGEYGFMDAVDLDAGGEAASFMSHHIGMSMLALSGIFGEPLSKLFSQSSIISGSLYRLNVKPPTERAGKKIIFEQKAAESGGVFRQTIAKRHDVPYLNVLTGGSYAAVTTESGAGYSMYGGEMLTVFEGGSGYAIYSGTDNILDGKCRFESDCSYYSSHFSDIDYHTEIFALPSLSGEIREVTVTNKGKSDAQISLSSIVQPCLCGYSEYIAHPAYSRMFVDVDLDSGHNALIAHRTNRKSSPYTAHCVIGAEAKSETSRFKLTRGGGAYRMSTINMPDKVMSMTVDMSLKPKESRKVSFLLLAAKNQDNLKKMLDRARAHGFAESMREAAANYSESLKRSPDTERMIRDIIARTVYSKSIDPTLTKEDIGRVVSLGVNVNCAIVSYDLSKGDTAKLRTALLALSMAMPALLPFQLLVIYKEERGYFTPLYDRIKEILLEAGIYSKLSGGSMAFIINENNEPLAAAAIRKISDCELSGSIAVDRSEEAGSAVQAHTAAAGDSTDCILPLGYGGLNERNEFVMDLSQGETPLPYSNIIANEEMGMLATESGGGYTYFGNSRESKITVWSNDPYIDGVSESVILSEGGSAWSVAKFPKARSGASYKVRHGFGCTEYYCGFLGTESTLTVYIDRKQSIKYYKLSIKNNGDDARKIKAVLSLDLVLGDFAPFNNKYLRIAKKGSIVHIANIKSGFTVDLFCDADSPDSALGAKGRAGRLETGCRITVPAGGESTVYFALSRKPFVFDRQSAVNALNDCERFYSSLNPFRINTPDVRLNALYNNYLMYQVLTSRFYARAGFYQAGGAVGFRDQLQDCLALLYHDPQLVRKHILTCCARQFEEGDVMHWWHPHMLGVRTRISDDKLFLPLAVAEYLEFTGDRTILDEKVSYCEGLIVEPGKSAVFGEARESKSFDTVLDHCKKAIDSVIFGINGLCLMGGGDWNDAMDDVGKCGEGESVFLSMFYYYVLYKMSRIVDESTAVDYLRRMVDVKHAVNSGGYDGQWYLRAFFDDGTPLGSKENSECSIDLLCQAWASLSGIDEKRAKTAVSAALLKLVDKENRIIKLLDPPFSKEGKRAGYISDYPQGVRENGGQYTHAAAWFIMALFKEGLTDEAVKMLDMVNPLSICETLGGAQKYMAEPYVLAGDVYSGEGRAGAAGWSWYTGSAAWFYKCITESLLGITLKGGRMYLDPRLPGFWDKYSVECSINSVNFCIEVSRAKDGVKRISVDSITYNCPYIELNKSINNKKVVVNV